MRKRLRVIRIAALAFVLLVLVGAACFWPSEPYLFLEGARIDEVRVSTEPTMTMSMGLASFQEMCVRRYFVRDLGDRMGSQLEADGWTPMLNFDSPFETNWWTRSGRMESVELVRVGESGGFVTITSLPTATDRFQAWLWRLTHR